MEQPKITILRGPERIRRRPNVIFGPADREGAVNVIRELLSVFITEAASGYSKYLGITLHEDRSVSVFSRDRGFSLEDTEENGMPAWYWFFCDFFPGPRKLDEEYQRMTAKKHNKLYGASHTPVTLCCAQYDVSFSLFSVQCVCELMQVEAVRNGVKKTLSFNRGYAAGALKTESCREETGTKITLRIDPEIFGNARLTFGAIDGVLHQAAVTVRGLRCELTDEATGRQRTYRFPKGSDAAAEGLLGKIQWKDRLFFPEYYTFDSFICQESNTLAAQTAKTVAECPGSINPLFLYGSRGVGKTHLLRAIAGALEKNAPELKVLSMPSDEFTGELIQAISRERLEAFREKYRQADVLLLEDIQFMAGKEATQEAFSAVFDDMYRRNKQIVLTADRKPADFSALGKTLAERMGLGTAIELKSPARNDRLIIARMKAQEMDLHLDEEPLAFIADNMTQNVRVIEGALKRLRACRDLNHMELTLENVTEALKDIR